MSKGKIIGYIRVSTIEQNECPQLIFIKIDKIKYKITNGEPKTTWLRSSD